MNSYFKGKGTNLSQHLQTSTDISDGGYLVKGAWWGSPMNRIVLRYADVLLMRAEALAQLDDGRPAEEADHCTIYNTAAFTKNKNEYLPIPFAQVSASNGYYTQNIGSR